MANRVLAVVPILPAALCSALHRPLPANWYEQTNGDLGVTGATYTPNASGSYYTIVTDANGCTATSNIVAVTVTRVIENINNSIINVYPNPSKGVVNISFENAINDQLSIEDFTGKEIYTEQINQKNSSVKTIDFSKYSNGIYFIKISNQKCKVVLVK